jgi:hypothetical protein
MSAALVLQGWWGSRLEYPEMCAVHLQHMLEGLAKVHRVFGRWKQQAETEQAAQKAFCSMPPAISELKEIIEQSGERHITGKPVPELGYSFSAWNRLDENHSVSFHARVGQQKEKPGDFNSIVFRFGSEAPNNRDLLNYFVLKDVLAAVGQAWSIDWGTVEPWSYDLRPRDETGDYRRPWGGWLTYLSPSFARKIAAPDMASVEFLPGGSLLIAVTKDEFDPNDSRQVAIYNAVQASLRPLQS